MWRPLESWATGASPDGRLDSAMATSDATHGDWSVQRAVSRGRRWLVVRVVVRPLRDLGAVRMLKDALVGLEGVESISMNGVSSYNVQFEGWFDYEREIVAELEQTLPFAFEVESSSGAELVLRLRAPDWPAAVMNPTRPIAARSAA